MKLTRKPVKRDWINIAVILILTGVFVWITAQYTKTFGQVKGEDIISTVGRFKEYILSYGDIGILVMIFFQILHVVVSAIPAAVVQFACGLIYGIPLGMLIGIVGVFIGTTITFCLSKFLGRQVVTLFVSRKDLDKIERIICKDTSATLLLFLFIIPFPKDFIAYFAGIANMKAHKFLLISTIGRLPGMFTATYLGANLMSRNYFMLITVTIASCVLFLMVSIFRTTLIKFFQGKRS